jgi:hypothetical protein
MSRRSLLWLLTPVLALGQGSQLPKYTVATLPAASAQPTYTVQVLDGANDQDCITGHGTKNVLCKSNGTAWVPVSPFQSLTTTGTSGPATLNLGVLNVPNYNGNSTSFRHNGTTLTGAFAGSPQIYDYDETTPAADGGFTNATGRFDTVTGKWNVEVPNSLGTQLRMNPGEDATHVFVPFGTCVFTTNNSSLTATGSGCDALGGYFASYKGGLFNHNVSAQMDWSNPVLPAWLPAGNVTGVQIVSYSSGQGTASGTCGGSGSCATNWLYPPFTTQKATTVTGVTGATFSSLTARASQSQSVYCTSCADPFTITGSFTVSQIGLLVQFSGVTNPSPSTALNVDWPLFYRHSDNSISVSDTYPYTIAPILTSLLTTPAVPNGSVVWTSDNTTSAVGDICTGSGTAGSDYALCISSAGGYTLLADFGGPGFGVLDINSSDSSLITSPTVGHVDAIINPAHHNTWTTQQTFSNSRLELLGLNSPLNARSGDGASGNCLISLGAGNTPIWQACPGTVGPGTVGYIPSFATTTTVGNSHIDDGVTTASTITSTEPIAIAVAGTQGGTADLTEGTAPSAAAGHDILYADSTAHCIKQALNGGSFACLGSGSGSLNVNGTPVSTPNLQDSATVTFGVSGSNIQATAAGGATDTLASVAAQPTPLATVLLQSLNNAANAAVNIVLFGDSFLDANKQNSTAGPTLRNDMAANRIRIKLQSIYGSHGTGLNQLLGSYDPGNTVNSDYYSFTGSFSQVSSLGPSQLTCCGLGNGSSLLLFTTGSTITFSDQRGIAWDALHIYGATTASSGSMSCAIDGGAPISVTNANYSATGSVNGGYTARRWDLSPSVSLTTHTAVCTVTGTFPIFGFEGTAGTTGVSVHNLGIGGAASYAFGADPTNELTFSDLISGGQQGALMMLQTNDIAHSTPTGTFQTNMQAFLTHELALPTAPTVLLAIPPVDSIASGHAPYTAVQQALCLSNTTIICANIQERGTTASGVAHGWGTTYDSTSGNWDLVGPSAGLHPNTRGQFDIGQLWYASLVNPTLLTASQISRAIYAVDTGTANVYAATMNPPISSYKEGLSVNVKIAHGNTTTNPTLNLNGLGVITIVKNASDPLTAGDLTAGEIHTFRYNGTNFQLLNPSGGSTTYTATSPIQVDTGTPGTVRYYCTTCATGGGIKNLYGLAITPPSSTGWTNLNFQTGTSVDYASGFGFGTFKPGLNYQLQGQYTAVSGTWTHVFGLQGDLGFLTKTSINLEAGWGVFVTDGTKSETFLIGRRNVSPFWCYNQVYFSTPSVNPPSSISSVCDANYLPSVIGQPYYMQIASDGTNINFGIGMDGFHFTQILSVACSTHFTNCAAITNVGWGSYIYGGSSGPTGPTESIGFFHYQ